jgi:hypothetical protein
MRIPAGVTRMQVSDSDAAALCVRCWFLLESARVLLAEGEVDGAVEAQHRALVVGVLELFFT